MSRVNVRRRRDGFTLMEVLLVLIILVVLAALSVGVFTGTRKKANEQATRAQIGALETPIDTFQMHCNQYPNSLADLRQSPSDAAMAKNWGGPYLKKAVGVDPWGNPYQYLTPGKHNTDTYDIWSHGPNGQDGTEDDIGNWEK